MHKTSINAVGLVILAELDTIVLRTARTGNASLLDSLVICPGLHRQQDAPSLSRGEYPACAAMTTGYVFRVENEATVLFLQRVGRTGHLTTLFVTPNNDNNHFWKQYLYRILSRKTLPSVESIVYSSAVLLSISTVLLLLVLEDWFGMLALVVLVLVRLLNAVVVRRRATPGWKGASEPGVQGDLLVLLSQDRWIRLKGAVDDLKAVTSGNWLREATFFEGCLISFATLLAYLDVALTWSATQEGKAILLVLWLLSAALLGVANESKSDLNMCGKLIKVDQAPRPFKRRLYLARELIEETGRDDWAVRLGMIQPKDDVSSEVDDQGPKLM